MTKLFGAILGAAIALILFIVLVNAVYQRPEGNWDWITDMVTLACGAVVTIGGAVAGAAIVAALLSGSLAQAGLFAVGLILLVAAYPAWLVWVKYEATIPRAPADAAERAAWVERTRRFHESEGFNEGPGRALASQVRTMLATGDASTISWRRVPSISDALVTHPAAYTPDDDGWRWIPRPDSSGYATIFLDPLLGRDGPVFETDAYDVFRREKPGAPAFAVDSATARLLALPECIAAFGDAARSKGSWDGTLPSLLELIATNWTPPDRCLFIVRPERPDRPGLPWRFEAQGHPGLGVGLEILPGNSGSPTAYQLSFMYAHRGFLRDVQGRWHMRSGSRASLDDPAPPPYLFDLSIPRQN